MSNSKRIALVVIVALWAASVVAACIVPPWVGHVGVNPVGLYAGYAPLWDPPKSCLVPTLKGEPVTLVGREIMLSGVLLEVLAATAVAGAAASAAILLRSRI